jgi:hypothetical protein
MAAPKILIILLLALTIILIAVVVFRPGITATRAGKMMAFLVLFALPVLCVGIGGSAELKRQEHRILPLLPYCGSEELL